LKELAIISRRSWGGRGDDRGDSLMTTANDNDDNDDNRGDNSTMATNNVDDNDKITINYTVD
jgi:hypothetical protein